MLGGDEEEHALLLCNYYLCIPHVHVGLSGDGRTTTAGGGGLPQLDLGKPLI